MTRSFFASIFGVAIFIAGCTAIPKGLEPVTGFEPDRYLGKWYEIARLDHAFERNLSNVSAAYTLKKNGDIRVQNRGFNIKTGTYLTVPGFFVYRR